MKQTILFLALLLTGFAHAQSTIALKGNVVDENKKPVESATVFLSVLKDSTLVDYTITNGKGDFNLKVKKQNKPVFLKVSMLGYSDFVQHYPELIGDFDLSEIQVKTVTTNLDELVIVTDIPPIRIKKDTVEFNAASFKVRPDANVEELLKQLPGVEIDADKKITVNGKEVNQILVNGKPFFDEDGKIALQNLPSELINKVQISDTKTKKEEFTKRASSSNNVSINLTIDEDKNKGFFGKFMGGYGSDKRYESSAIANYFKGKQKISVLASSNNINASGFSMDEVFDNMGGGRGRSGSYGGGGGSGGGITQSNMVGINYADEFIEDLSTAGSYFFNSSDSENKNRATRINLLPSGEFTTFSNSQSKQSSETHNGNFSVEYKIDSTATIFVSPKLSKSHRTSRFTSDEYAVDQDGSRLNENRLQSFNTANGVNFSNQIRYSKNFGKQGQYFTVALSNQNSNDEGQNSTDSETVFFQDPSKNDFRKQFNTTRSTSDNYSLEFEYSQPIVDSLAVEFHLAYDWKNSVQDDRVFDFNDSTQGYDELNTDLTNYYQTQTRVVKPTTAIRISKSKFNLNLAPGLTITQFDVNAVYQTNDIAFSKEYVLPAMTAYMNYQFNKKQSFWGSYQYNTQLQQARAVLDYEDRTNPLNTIIGNPDLSPNKFHSTFLSFRNYDFASRSGYSVYGGGNYFDNQAVTSSVYDENRMRTTTYKELSGAYSYWIGGNWSKSHTIDEHKLRYGVDMRYTYGNSKGFTDGEQYRAKSSGLSPRIYFNWDYGDLISIMPSYSYTSNTTDYENYAVKAATNFSHRLQLQATAYWPENWVFGNDFGYTYNSNIAPGFKRDFYLWNTSLSYAFFDKQFTAKVKVYDLLNQNISTTRTIDPTSIIDAENTVLKRYVMFSLTYKIDQFGGKKTTNERPKRGNSGRIRIKSF
ncbi:outer membrane beta-barrel protein [Flavobacterium sp. JP2137]|uniref:outer membrane beta-barrel protein n=1 Tax=Flavobacterium sp. JP2137 TaxID=3414510 RepID=UPI003D2FED49